MRIKELFTVPDGKKITEKTLSKVLLSSICGILLCMACLAGTTWAWFSVSIENIENVVQIGTADVKVVVNGGTNCFVSGSDLPQGNCEIVIEHSNLPDDFDKKATLYVTIICEEEVAGYAILNDDNEHKITLQCDVGEAVRFSWIVSWFPPVGTVPLEGNKIPLENEESTDPPEETTGSTVETTEATVETTEATGETTMPPVTGSTTTPEETGTPPTTVPSSALEETTIPTTAPTIVPTETTEPTTVPDEASIPAGAG